MNRPTRQLVEEARAGGVEKHLAMVGEKHPTEGGSTLVKPPGRDLGLDRGVARYRVRDVAPVPGEVTLWHFFRGAYRSSRQVCSLGKRTLPCQVTYEFGYWVALEHFRVKYSDLSVEEDPFANWPEDANMQMEFSQPFDDSVTPEDRTSLYFFGLRSLATSGEHPLDARIEVSLVIVFAYELLVRGTFEMAKCLKVPMSWRALAKYLTMVSSQAS
ncbi:hypothetical protein B296_00018864 [Ensete ventricosum]|uniref:Uncharacterized protein n=1 Tax=Ensete ventricosum TaxID=4639 RepID=A0A427AJ12_ENSVE|nr:hypothetical protein B296_00018864 [Ensete ventricosum]